MRRAKNEHFPQGSLEDLQNRFLYHAPGADHRDRHEEIRELVMRAVAEVYERLPGGREASLFLTKMEEASFWAHASVARQALE